MTIFTVSWCYVLLAWVLLEIGLRSWRRPERLDGSWAWTWPAPSRLDFEYGPARPPLLPDGPAAGVGWMRHSSITVDMVPCVSPSGEGFWSAPELAEHAGATIDWSPKHAAAEAEAGMLPLDDVDEWLAERVRSFEHALSRIGARRVWLGRGLPQRTVDEELEAFQRGSMALGAYRSMILDSTGGYTMREAAQLEALLVAC